MVNVRIDNLLQAGSLLEINGANVYAGGAYVNPGYGSTANLQLLNNGHLDVLGRFGKAPEAEGSVSISGRLFTI